jgi:hypothetical protein
MQTAAMLASWNEMTLPRFATATSAARRDLFRDSTEEKTP